jgi:hypothetical protein
MIIRQLALAACAVMIFSSGSAYAGPAIRAAKMLAPSITTGAADTKAHPPTDTMNQVTGNKTMSSQDAQRQQQVEPRGSAGPGRQTIRSSIETPRRRDSRRGPAPVRMRDKCGPFSENGLRAWGVD